MRCLFSLIFMASMLAFEARGDMPSPVRQLVPNPINWVELTSEAYQKAVGGSYGDPDFEAESSPLRLKWQAKADELYDVLILNDPELLVEVPKPKIEIMRYSGGVAFASRLGQCLRVRVRIAGRQDRPSDSLGILLGDEKGRWGLYAINKIRCLNVIKEVPPLLVYRYLMEDLKVHGCTIRAEKNQLTLGLDCDVSSFQAGGAEAIVVQSSLSHITLSTGLIDKLGDDDQVFYSLLHELAHYYRSHGALNRNAFNYYYQDSEEQLKRSQPIATTDKSLLALGNQLQKLKKYLVFKVPGQRYHSSVFSYFSSVVLRAVKPYCQLNACDTGCDELVQIVADHQQGNLFGLFPIRSLPTEAKNLYQRYENVMGSCLRSIFVDVAPMTRDLARSIYWKVSQEDSSDMTNLNQYFLAMNQAFVEEDRYEHNLLSAAYERGLGYYTTEQEADNFALEWMSLLGVPTQAVIDHWFLLFSLSMSKDYETKHHFGFASCLEAYSATPPWRQDRDFAGVPIGLYSLIHHSHCYRIYNMARRITSRNL